MPKQPSIVGEPSIVQKGAAVILECTVEADPTPSAEWFKDEKPIKDDASYAMKIEPLKEAGKAIVLCEIKKFDKPLAGLYKAKLTNSAGSINATFTVSAGGTDFRFEIAQCPLKGFHSNAMFATKASTSTAGDAPEMPEKPKIVQKDGGKILGIKVQAKSKTEPKVEWQKDEKPLAPSDRIKQTVKKDEKDAHHYTIMLEITSPAKADEGKYGCKVSNADGSNMQTLNLAFD